MQFEKEASQTRGLKNRFSSASSGQALTGLSARFGMTKGGLGTLPYPETAA